MSTPSAGFALLGIFVVNITFMASAYPGNLVDDPNFSSPIDGAVRFLVAALFSMKFYLLFSFLFGYSFVLQMDAAGQRGLGVRAAHAAPGGGPLHRSARGTSCCSTEEMS